MCLQFLSIRQGLRQSQCNDTGNLSGIVCIGTLLGKVLQIGGKGTFWSFTFRWNDSRYPIG